MNLTLPDFPADLVGRLIFLCTILLALVSLLPVAMPQMCKRVWLLVEKSGHVGSVGEFRVAGLFVTGYCLAALLLAQPVIWLGLGMALAFAAFGRILSIMSDQALTFINGVFLLVQIAFAALMLTTIFDVWTADSTFVFPESTEQRIVFACYVTLFVAGAGLLLAPRLVMSGLGLVFAENSQGGEAVVRSAGGFLAGLALTAVLVANPLLDLAVGIALAMSFGGRIVAMFVDGGKTVFHLLLADAHLVLTGVILATVFGYI